jgi:hypothetical protein
MSEPLSERRIPQALKRNVKSGATTSSESKAKSRTIKDSGYVRWTFICLPGAAGSSSNLFILIGVEGAEMNLEKPSQPALPQSDDDASGSFE